MDKFNKFLKGLSLSSKNTSGTSGSGSSAFSGAGRKLGMAQPEASGRRTTDEASRALPDNCGEPTYLAEASTSLQLSQGAPQPPPHEPPNSSPEVYSSFSLLLDDPHRDIAATVLAKLLENIILHPTDQKFRRIRLQNPRIQGAVVDSQGGLEILLACGFRIIFEDTQSINGIDQHGEGFAVLEPESDIEPLQLALRMLRPLCPAARIPQAEGEIPVRREPAADKSDQQSVGCLPNDDKVARNTRVLLPVAVNSEVPPWFYDRSSAEIKATFLEVARRREQSQMLMTKAMRERLRLKAEATPGVTGSDTAKPQRRSSRATINVRLPEGLAVKGEFGAEEPVVAVCAWIADCLADPLQTFELILPDRRPLETVTGAGSKPLSVRRAGLLPAVTLNLRWSGDSAIAMRQIPALRPELMMAVS